MTKIIPKWLAGFFEDPNSIDLEKILSGSYPGDHQSALEGVVLPALRGEYPMVLPMVSSGDLCFYGVARDGRSLSELLNTMKAHLGNAYTSTDLRIYTESQNDYETSLLGNFPFGYIRVHLISDVQSNTQTKLWMFKTLTQMLMQFRARPHLTSVAQRPVGRVLRDFFTACSHRSGSSTESYLEELKKQGSISRRNIASLELQVLDATQNWRSILDHPQLADILSGRTPQRVSLLLIRALYHCCFNSADAFDLSHVSLEKIRKDFLPFSQLFFKHPGLDQEDTYTDEWKIWAVGAAALGYARVYEFLPSIIDTAWQEKLSLWSGLIKEATDSEPSLSPLLSSSPSLDIAHKLLLFSVTCSSGEGAQIFSVLNGYPNVIRDEIISHAKFCLLWEGLEGDFSQEIEVESWRQWFKWISDDPSCDNAFEIAQNNCDSWPGADWDEAFVLQKLNAALGTKACNSVRNIIPILLRWLDERQIVPSVSLLTELMQLLALDEMLSEQDMVLMGAMVEVLIQNTHTRADYVVAIESLELLWAKLESLTVLEQMLEVMDSLADMPCADSEKRLQLWQFFQSYCMKKWSRISTDIHWPIRQLAIDFVGSDQQFADIRSEEDSSCGEQDEIDLSGKRLGIYTLTEGAGRRAKESIEKMFPGLEVLLNHDKSATDRLINLAKTSNYFIFSSKSAAHQAFYPVSKLRDDLLYPEGKGSTSIVRCLLLHVTNMFPSTTEI